MNTEDIIRLLKLPSRLMRETEVAKAKDCSVQKLRYDRHLGRGLPFIRDGRSVRYLPYDVALDIMKGRVEPQGEAGNG